MTTHKITAKEVRCTANPIKRGRVALAYQIQSGHAADQERYQFIHDAFVLLERKWEEKGAAGARKAALEEAAQLMEKMIDASFAESKFPAAIRALIPEAKAGEV
jgi:hypothetical protein